MTITYYGLSCLKFQGSSRSGKDVILVTDPYSPSEAGLKFPSIKADIVVISNSDSPLHNNTAGVSALSHETVLTISSPGEYHVRDVVIRGFSIGNHVGYRIEHEQISICFLGSHNRAIISDNENQSLENIDILCIPVGGKSVLSGRQASEIVRQLEPRLVIPVYYHMTGIKESLDKPQEFFKSLGAGVTERYDKFKITPKDLPQDSLKAIELIAQ